jgi:hypothetical protein
MQQLIKIDKSFLNVYPYNENRLLIKNELIVKLYGKIVHKFLFE